jgi:hypothetical protein
VPRASMARANVPQAKTPPLSMLCIAEPRWTAAIDSRGILSQRQSSRIRLIVLMRAVVSIHIARVLMLLP